jgi:peroxiredoxin
MVLLFFILIILWQRNSFTDRKTGMMVGMSIIFCAFLAIYAVKFNPPYDGLPYAIGQDIQKNMKPSETLQFMYKYEKDGKILDLKDMPTDTTYKFKEMITLNADEAKAKITDYNVWKDGDSTDYKAESFVGKKLMIIVPVVEKASTDDMDKIRALAKSLEGSDIKVWLLSGSTEEAVNNFRHENQLAFPSFSADTKVLKTIGRSNPSIWLLQDGIVKGKWAHADAPDKAEVISKF